MTEIVVTTWVFLVRNPIEFSWSSDFMRLLLLSDFFSGQR